MDKSTPINATDGIAEISEISEIAEIDYARLIQRGHNLRSQAVSSAARRLWAALTRHRVDPPDSGEATSVTSR